jgi:hypothetical protein
MNNNILSFCRGHFSCCKFLYSIHSVISVSCYHLSYIGSLLTIMAPKSRKVGGHKLAPAALGKYYKRPVHKQSWSSWPGLANCLRDVHALAHQRGVRADVGKLSLPQFMISIRYHSQVRREALRVDYRVYLFELLVRPQSLGGGEIQWCYRLGW